MDAHLCQQFRSKTRGKNMPCLWNPRVKQSSFSQKMIILVSLPWWFHPPPSRPPKLGGDGSCGCQISPTSPLHNTGKKLTCLWSLWVQQSNFSQKIVILASLRHCVIALWRHFGVISGSVLYPQDPHDLMGMVPMADKSSLRHGKKIDLLVKS